MKKIIHEVIAALTIGITIGVILSVVFSGIFGQGVYAPSTPRFMAQFKTSLGAMIASIVLWALMGIVFYFTAKIFKQEKWGLLKMSFTHYLVTLFFFFPLAYLAGWFPHDLKASTGFLVTYTCIYLAIYLINFISAWIEVKRINQKVK